jgi:hypothetical protein
MQSVRAAVLLLALIALAIGGVVRGAAEERDWSLLKQYWGRVKSIKVDKCGSDQGYAKVRLC